ncbi:endonuclease/exonuclease/phosphatase family protein [Candidatus Micrarchaeota archaeon]|nr:endonuclease/exonuclease/phosphatase family protein [Candidatus Micrarchaeota archaeon]
MGRRRKRVYGMLIALLALTMIALALLPGVIAWGKPAPSVSAAPDTKNDSPAAPPSAPQNASGEKNASLKIATFNIQVFGESKRSKPDVMDVLAKTARNFDIMAVQELRDDTETTLPAYLDAINSLPGPDYAAVSSPRLGRTSSKENYAFIYNTGSVVLVPGSNFTFADPPEGSAADLFQREPFIARFRPLSDHASAFDFALITIHTDPDTTPQELIDLPLALSAARSRYGYETDFILLGDMNADCSYLTPSESATLALRNSSFLWAVPDDADTMVKSTDCAYDRIILFGSAQEHYGGAWGVYRFDDAFGLNQSVSEGVSDHYPVWVIMNPEK